MDYDVGVTGLSSPPPTAVLTPYRPAVSVRNNGIHDAIASGYLRIYAAGLLIFETEVYSGTLAPDATGTADAVDYWTPPTEGSYVVQGYVSTPLDQVEHNNNLAPVTIVVTGGPVPPPPVVPLHAAQHEEGGTDPVNVDGLPGILKDRQLPSAHASQHQAGGTDTLNVAGLAGVLGDAQTPTQHGNAHHSPDMATADELDAHAGSIAAHTAATNLANRDTIGPLTGKLSDSQLYLGTADLEDPEDDPDAMGLRLDRNRGYVNPAHHAYKHAVDGLDPITMPAVTTGIEQNKTCTPASGAVTLVTCELTAAQAKPGTCCKFHAVGAIACAVGAGQSVVFTLYLEAEGAPTALAACTFDLEGNMSYDFHIEGTAGIGILSVLAAALSGEVADVAPPYGEIHAVAGAGGPIVAPGATSRLFLSAAWSNGEANSSLSCSNALALGVVRP